MPAFEQSALIKQPPPPESVLIGGAGTTVSVCWVDALHPLASVIVSATIGLAAVV